MVEKAVDIEIKTSLKLPSEIRKINSRYSRGYKSLVKKDKDDNNWEHRDRNKDKDKTKSQYPPANSQLSTQASKKDKRDGNHHDH